MEEKGRKKLLKQNFKTEEIFFDRILHMRYEKTDCILMCSPKIDAIQSVCLDSAKSINPKEKNENELELFKNHFLQMYKREFGFIIPDRNIIVDDIRFSFKKAVKLNFNFRIFS